MLKVTSAEISVAGLGGAFDGFKIAHISDFHNDPSWERVAEAVKEASVDMVAVTGDLIDRRRAGSGHAEKLISALVSLAPVCYVTGNHEAKSPEFPALQKTLEGAGVLLLRDARTEIVRGRDVLALVGLDDPGFARLAGKKEASVHLCETLRSLAGEGPTLVLTHRPDFFAAYAAAGASLVLAGHAHGGQWRLPMGLYAPGQGIFPKYTSGVYREGKAQMFVSRGIGNSRCPLRIHNPPEVPILTLRAPSPDPAR